LAVSRCQVLFRKKSVWIRLSTKRQQAQASVESNPNVSLKKRQWFSSEE
jgi:hypothetical protein